MSQVDEALEQAEPGDDLSTAAAEGSLSAGETGDATDAPADPPPDKADVIIGEIPDAHDITHLRWTARCSWDAHDLLGTFDTREEAEQARTDHLGYEHGARTTAADPIAEPHPSSSESAVPPTHSQDLPEGQGLTERQDPPGDRGVEAPGGGADAGEKGAAPGEGAGARSEDEPALGEAD